MSVDAVAAPLPTIPALRAAAPISQPLSRRIRAVSFILIVLVTYIHARNTDPPAGRPFASRYLEQFIGGGIAHCAVPFFFLISGYLFFHNFDATRDSIHRKYLSRIRTLLVPYLCWSALGIALYWAAQSIPATRPYFSNPDALISTFSPGRLLFRWLLYPIPYPLWFIRDLMVFVLIHPLIALALRHCGVAPAMALLALWTAGIDTPLMSHGPLRMLKLEDFAAFVLGGHLATCRPPHLDLEKQIPFAPAICLAFLLVIACKAYVDATGGASAGVFSKAAIALGIPALWTAAGHFPRILQHPAILRLSQFTFFLYAAHEPTLTILKKLVSRAAGPSQPAQAACFLLCPLIVIALCLAIAALLKHHARPLYALLTGNR